MQQSCSISRQIFLLMAFSCISQRFLIKTATLGKDICHSFPLGLFSLFFSLYSFLNSFLLQFLSLSAILFFIFVQNPFFHFLTVCVVVLVSSKFDLKPNKSFYEALSDCTSVIYEHHNGNH